MRKRLEARSEEPLFTITVKVPESVARTWRTVAADAGLELSPACRFGLTRLAEVFEGHWKRGPALPIFLEALEFAGDQLAFFFRPRR